MGGERLTRGWTKKVMAMDCEVGLRCTFSPAYVPDSLHEMTLRIVGSDHNVISIGTDSLIYISSSNVRHRGTFELPIAEGSIHLTIR